MRAYSQSSRLMLMLVTALFSVTATSLCALEAKLQTTDDRLIDYDRLNKLLSPKTLLAAHSDKDPELVPYLERYLEHLKHSPHANFLYNSIAPNRLPQILSALELSLGVRNIQETSLLPDARGRLIISFNKINWVESTPQRREQLVFRALSQLLLGYKLIRVKNPKASENNPYWIVNDQGPLDDSVYVKYYPQFFAVLTGSLPLETPALPRRISLPPDFDYPNTSWPLQSAVASSLIELAATFGLIIIYPAYLLVVKILGGFLSVILIFFSMAWLLSGAIHRRLEALDWED